jgi:NAD+ synthase
MLNDLLALNCAVETDRICSHIRRWTRELHRQGAVVAMSGGIDSSVVAALCTQALGAHRVLGLLLPERDSSVDTLPLSRSVATSLGMSTVEWELSGILDAVGCYRLRDEAIQKAVPRYGNGDRAKIVLPSILEHDGMRLYSVVVEDAIGGKTSARLDADSYLGIVAATNFKQRVRKMLEYYHADRMNYLVAGTPNRLEHELGFFVKQGDGAADIKPIAHLYKSQVYALAAHLRLPESVQNRAPTTDTYPLPQSQQEFYFSVGYETLDLCLCAHDAGMPAEEAAAAAGLTREEVKRVFADIDQKRKATRYLGLEAQTLIGQGDSQSRTNEANQRTSRPEGQSD